VIAARPLEPWLHRHIGMDWGYAHDGAAYWGCEASDGRFHVYREMVEKNLGAEKWGAEVAIRSLDDLRGVEGGTMSLYLSPDAWDKRNETRTIADQIADGVRVRAGAGFGVPDGRGGRRRAVLQATRGAEAVRDRDSKGGRISASRGAAYLRSLLRWWPLTRLEAQQTFDSDLFMRLLQVEPKRAMEYRAAFQRRETAEVLPGILIHDCCPRLIDCIGAVLHDERNPEDVEKRDGDDCLRRVAVSHVCADAGAGPGAGGRVRREADGGDDAVARRGAGREHEGVGGPEGGGGLSRDGGGGDLHVPRLSSRRGMEFWRN